MPRFETHALTAPALFLFFNTFHSFEVDAEIVSACIIGGVICEVDSETSVVGRTFPIVPIARRFGIVVQHRGFFHSLNFIGLMGVLLCPLIWTGHLASYIAFLLSMLQHQALDGLTPEPVRWLTPFSKLPFRFSPNPDVNIPNGSSKEVKLRWAMFFVMLVFAVINYLHPRWMLNYYFADVQAGREYIHEYGNRHLLKAEFTGKEFISKKIVQAQWPVEGYINNRIILRGPDNRLRSIVDEYDSDASLRSEKIRIWKDQQIRMEIRSVNMTGKTIAQLHQYVDAGKDYRLFAKELILADQVYLTQDPVLFNPVRASGKRLTLEFATLKDLAPVNNAVIEQGEILLRYHLKPGENLDSGITDEIAWKVVEITIEKPSELRVKKGDEVEAKGVVAVRDKFVQKINLNEQEQSNTQAKLAALEQLQKEGKSSFDTQKAFQQTLIKDAEKDLQNHQYLLKKDLIARQDVIKKEHYVQSLQSELQRLELEFEKKTAQYHEQLAELKLTLKRLQAELSELKEKAYINSRIEGRVQDIISEQKNGEIKVRLFIEPREK